MALPALASISDLATWLGQTIASEDARAQAVLAAASSLVRSAAGQTWVTDDELDADLPDVAVTITLTVASRAWANPTGATVSTTGPFSGAWPGLMLLDDERAVLSRLRTTTGGLYTISTTRSDTGLPDRYLEVVGSELIPHVPIEDVNW